MTTPADRILAGFTPLRPEDLADRLFLDHATDVPSSAPAWPLPVARAGVVDETLSFSLPSFVGSDERVTVAGTVSAAGALPADRRGVHMSRIVSAIDAVAGREWPSLEALLTELVTLTARLQDLPEALVEVRGIAIAHRPTPVTGMPSPDRFTVSGDARLSGGEVTVNVGLGAGVMTACPCTQAFSTYSTVIDMAERYGLDLANELGEQLVTYTHSQRGELAVEAEADGGVSLPELYTAMAAGAHLVFNLLKRPDEHHLVRQAHQRPQFTEDVVRTVAAELVASLSGRLPAERRISVECRNIESIHAHDVHAVVSGTLRELAAALGVPRATT